MEKRISLGVQHKNNKKPTIKRNKKRKLLKKVVDYLKSDTYMFAPLISPTATHHFLASRIATSFTASTPNFSCPCMDCMKGRTEKVVEYLKSDSFFYAPLFASQQIASSHRGFGEYWKQETMQVSRGRKDDEATTVKALNIRADEEMSNVSGQKKLVHRESVKHVVFQSCRSSSMSGEGVLQSRLRKLLID
uniref:Uncharacterized protein n=1 Tax=Manihot esculenta TaxID=3983 RepID=A0A2C9ULW6_MANES